MADLYRRLLDKCGKGGVHCDCCNDFRKEKRKLRQITRSRIKDIDIKNLKKFDDIIN